MNDDERGEYTEEEIAPARKRAQAGRKAQGLREYVDDEAALAPVARALNEWLGDTTVDDWVNRMLDEQWEDIIEERMDAVA